MANPPHVVRSESDLDEVDRRLLELLEADARMPNNRLAARAGVSPSTSLARVRSLVERGVLRGFRAEIDPTRIGRGVQAVVAVRLRSHDRRHIESFAAAIPQLGEVVQVFHVAGVDDYLLHVAVPSAEYLRDWILDHITIHPAVAHSQTSLIFGHDRVSSSPLPPAR